MARVFAYIPPFISQILDFIYWTVLIFILIYFEWRHTENQQYGWRQFMNAAKIRPDLRFMHMHSQVSKHRFGDFFPLLSLSLRCSISQMTKMCFSFLFFFKMTIIRVMFSCLYCWTIKIWLLIFLATGKSGVLFQGRYFFEAKSIFWGNVCFWSNRLLSIRNTLSFLIVGGPPACHVFEFCIQVMLSIAVESASIIWNVTPIASTMTTKAEFIGGLTVLRCFIYQCLNI